jgi:hypothetical protein
LIFGKNRFAPKIKSGREPTGQRHGAPSKRWIIKGNAKKTKRERRERGKGSGGKEEVAELGRKVRAGDRKGRV